MFIFWVLPSKNFQKGANHTRLPVVSVNNIREETNNWKHIKHGFTEITEPFNIVIIAKKVWSIKILFILNKIIDYSIELIFINSAVFLSPRKFNSSFTNKSKIFFVFFRNFWVKWKHHTNINIFISC